MASVGLDIGTAFIVKAQQVDDNLVFKEFRNAFFKMKPSTPIASKMMEKSLTGSFYFKDSDGSFVLVGKEAINKAVERNDIALRPLKKGVINPLELEARKVLKFILTQLVGKPEQSGETLVYSIPAAPFDQDEDNFDTGYHEDMLRKDLGELGWNARPLNEAEAICYSELENDDYTGLAISCGSGMCNICLMSTGEVINKFSLTKAGGDWIDRMAAQSTAQKDTVVQMEKENGDFVIGQKSTNQILDAVALYYVRLIDYIVKCLSHKISKTKDLPQFSQPIPIVIAGGTSLAKGFIETFNKSLSQYSFPFSIKEVRHAKDPLKVVARGCLLASSI